ncbi:cupin domain-containing protein [Ottowia sp. SB7-C50]|uniref:cupin domain-containing protein n=1 Tax=Ottowia sp. SB7-C50 TaxID=3081231 RepID=UPI0029544ACF|nr:cupin domain-containing protein [Ottowia sp. SB7-C50]WOP15974.1 cupin domain-containing protein [Ottowia sp. SB7-C50]
MRASLHDLLAQLPAAPTRAYPEGLPFAMAFAHGSMSVELYAPGSNADGRDRQQPHAQDELYVVQRGHATLRIGAQNLPAAPGDVLFVPADADHRFEAFTPDFATWVIFYGPAGGEKP